MCAGAMSMPAVSVGRMISVDRRAPDEHVGHRQLDGVEVDAQAGGEVRLRIHVDAEDAQPVLVERAGEIDGRRRLADAALLIGDRDHVRHRGFTSFSREGGVPRAGQGMPAAIRRPWRRPDAALDASAATASRRPSTYPQDVRVVHRSVDMSAPAPLDRSSDPIVAESPRLSWPRAASQRCPCAKTDGSRRCPPTMSDSRGSTRCAPNRCSAAERTAIEQQHAARQADGARAARAAARRRIRSSSSIAFVAHRSTRVRRSPSSIHSATASSPDTAGSTAAPSSSSARTSRSSADRCPRRTPRRSAR